MLELFKYAQDRWGDWVPSQLLSSVAWTIVLLSVAFVGIHYARRGWSQPTFQPEEITLPTKQVEKYLLTQRLYHWGNFLIIAALLISGIFLFLQQPSTLGHLLGSWFQIHEISASLFIVGLIVHIIAATQRGEPQSMWFQSHDFQDVMLSLKNFFGQANKYPRSGKYDVVQKIYHAVLAVIAVGMIFTGGVMWLNARAFLNLPRKLIGISRLIHDLFTFLLFALIIGHIYFGLLKSNKEKLKAMISGWLPARYIQQRYSLKKWKLKKE